jgi:tetratricopeptide (TPR) repeat protein
LSVSVDGWLRTDRAATLPPLDAQALAHAALAERREPEVIAAINASARRHDDPVVWHLLGLLHRTQGDLAPALAAFDAAFRLTPAQPLLLHARARATLEAGLDARDRYDAARTVAQNDGDVILGQAAALAEAGDDRAADDLLVAMLRAHPGWLPGHQGLMRMRYAAGAAWQEEIDRAITGAPLDWRLHDLKLSAWLRIGQAEAALSALAAAPDVAELAAIRAAITSEFGPAAAAERQMATLSPRTDPLHRLHVLRHHLRRGRPEEVVALSHPAPTADDLPYLSLAYRLLDDPRAAALDDPAAISVVDLPLTPTFLTGVATLLRRLHRARRQPLDQSVRAGTQTGDMLLWRVDPEIAELRGHVRRAVDRYAAQARARAAPLPVPRHPRVVGSWSVRLLRDGHHDAHVHPEGWLSSALYIALPPSDGEQGWLTLGEPQRALATGLAPLRTIEPRVGRLVLFPSHTWHATRPFTQGERLTVAFDVA